MLLCPSLVFTGVHVPVIHFANQVGSYLADERVWAAFKTVFRIHAQMRPPQYSAVLCDFSQSTLTDITHMVFCRLRTIDLQHSPPSTLSSNSSDPCHPGTSNISDNTSQSSACPGDSTDSSAASPTPPSTEPSKSRQGYGLRCAVTIFDFIADLATCALQGKKEEIVSRRERLTKRMRGFSRSLFLSSEPTTFSTYYSDPAIQTPTAPSEEKSKGSALESQAPAASVRDSKRKRDSMSVDLPSMSVNNHTLIACKLLLTALTAGGPAFNKIEELIMLIEDDVFKFLLRSARGADNETFSHVFRIFHHLMTMMRQRLSMQLEVFINTVFLRTLSSKGNSEAASNRHDSSKQTNTYDLKEIALENLLDFTRQPWFFTELYSNYDCNPEASDLFNNLFKGLCKCVFPVTGLVTGNHLLALQCLIEGLRWLRARSPVSLLASSNDTTSLTTSTLTASAPEQTSSLDPLQPTRAETAELGRLLTIQRDFKNRFMSCTEEFNRSAKKGLAKMQNELGLFLSFTALKAAPKDHQLTADEQTEVNLMARLLRFAPGFDKVAIGQYLSETGHLSAHIRNAFVALFDFTDQHLDDALRMFLEAFRLPLEAQQIDRAIQMFAGQYHENNPQVLLDADAVHTLSFSLIMLNTDAHNELVKNKMTLAQFISNNRGINAGQDVPQPMLERLYAAILGNEIKMSGSGVNAEIGDALWCDLLKTMNIKKARREYLLATPEIKSSCNQQMFVECWSPVIAALSLLFGHCSSHIEQQFSRTGGNASHPRTHKRDTTRDRAQYNARALSTGEDVVSLLMDGFTLLADIAASGRHTQILDKIVSTVGKLTGLLDDNFFAGSGWHGREMLLQHRNEALLRFHQDPQAQFSTKLLLSLVRMHGDTLRSGWRDMMMVLLKFQLMDVLPGK